MSAPAWLLLKAGDITQEDCDAIVNAANRHLEGRGGVDGAIHRAAGMQELRAACKALGGCSTGGAKATPGFALKARHIIHAVGPIYREERDPAGLLASAYTASLRLAADLGCRSIAFPAISCGVYGYPHGEAARVSRDAILAFQAGPRALDQVRLVFFDRGPMDAARAAWGTGEGSRGHS